ncbi:MAG: hypothetical protein AMXMBFR64_16140 [Myxococcales bacterium]
MSAALRTLIAVAMLVPGAAAAQNLLVNGSCDDALVGAEIPGWTEVTGTSWTRRSSSPGARDGSYYFYAGANAAAELAQSVDVSSMAADIDGGAHAFRFSGFIRSFDQAPSDTARIVVEYRSGAGTVLDAFDTGPTAYFVAWTPISDTRTAPVGTRTIRVRLESIRFNGTNNDGYFDGLRLVALGAPPAVAGTATRIEDLRAEATEGGVRLRWTAPTAGLRRGLSPDLPALDCVDVAETGNTASGVYWLATEGGPSRAFCDLDTDGGGWTLCYTATTTVRLASETTYDPALPYGTDGYRADCRGVPFRDVLYVNHDGGDHAWFRRDAAGDVTMGELGYNTNGAELGTFTGHGATDAGVPYQLMVCDTTNWYPGLMVSGAGSCWKSCGNWCSDSTSLYYRMRGLSYVGAAFNQPGHRDLQPKRLSVGVRRRVPNPPPGASTYEVRSSAVAITDAAPWEPTPSRGEHDGTVDDGALTLAPPVAGVVDDRARVLAVESGLTVPLGVAVTDGAWIYAKPQAGSGPSIFWKIGSGMGGTVAGQVESSVGPDTTASMSAAYLDGFIYNPISGNPYALERLDVATGVLETVAVPDGLLRRDTGRVEAGGEILIGSDGQHLLCLAHSIEGGSLNGWRLRTYGVGPLGEPDLLDESLIFTTSYAARSVLADGSVVIPMPWGNSSGTARILAVLDPATLAQVRTSSIIQCSSCWDFDAPAGGGYDPLHGLFWVGDGVRPRLAAFPATRVTSAGTFTSEAHDFGAPVTLGSITWDAEIPAGASATVSARTSQDLATWSAFAPVSASGGTPAVPAGRYAQVRVTMSRGSNAPRVRGLHVSASGETWSAATPVTGAPEPGPPGTPQEMVVPVAPGEAWFAIRAVTTAPGPASVPAHRPAGTAITLDSPPDGATVAGLVPVQVTAAATSVELRVDGALVATLEAPSAPAAQAASPRWRLSRTVRVDDAGPGLSATTTVSVPLDVADLIPRGFVRPDLSDLRLLGSEELPRLRHRDGTLRFRLPRPIPPGGTDTFTLVMGGDPSGPAPDSPGSVALFHDDFEGGDARWTNLQGPWAVAEVGGRTAMQRAVTSETLGGGVRAWLTQAEPGPLPQSFDLEALVRSPSGYSNAYWGFFLYGSAVTVNDATYIGSNHLIHHTWTTNGGYTEIQSVSDFVRLDHWHRLSAHVRGVTFDTRLDGTLTVFGRPGHGPAGTVGLWSEATYGAGTAPAWYDDLTIWDRGVLPPRVVLGPETPAPTTPSTWTWAWDTTSLAPGTHTIEARAVDAFGSASATAVVTVEAPVVSTPTLTAPADGALVEGTTVHVTGTAPAGSVVTVTVDGEPAATTTAAGGTPWVVEAEAPSNTVTGGMIVGGAIHVGSWPGPSTTNVALGRKATANKTYSGSYPASQAVDGRPESGAGTYWLAPNGAKDAHVTVDLGAPHVVDRIRVINTRNGSFNDRSTKDYRLGISMDGVTFTVVASGTLADDDWTTWVTSTLAPPLVARHVRFYADTYFGSGAGLGELEVYGTEQGAWARVETPWHALPGTLVSFTADASGAAHEVSVEGETWLPISALPGLSLPAGQARLRTTLVRSSLTSDPWVDRLQVVASGAGGGPGAFATDVPVIGGIHQIAASATLGAVTSSPSATVTIDVDPAPPGAVNDLLATPGAAQGSVVLTWTAPGDDGAAGTAAAYQIWRHSAPLSANLLQVATVVPAPAPAAGGTPESLTVTGLATGTTYHWILRAVDDRGQEAPLSNGSSTIPGDTTAPSLTITAPVGGAHLRSSQTLTATATDPSGVATVTWKVDGTTVAVATTPFSATIDTAGWADGQHTIVGEARDTFGNLTTKQVTVTFDNTAPSLALDPVASPRATAVTVTYTTSDALTPAGQLVVRDQDGRAPPLVYGDEGPRTVTVTSTDLAGNVASALVAFLIDQTGPAPIVDLEATPGGGGVELAWTAPSDALTSVASYEVRVAAAGGTAFGTGADGPLSVTGTVTVDSVRTPVVGDVPAGSTTVPVVNAAGFQAGDEVILWDAQGPLSPGRWTSRRLSGVAGGALLLDAPLADALPGATDQVVAQRVPQYTNVTVNAGGILTASPWDGQTGGLVAFRATGTVTILAGGKIDASGLGFRGSPASGTWQCRRNQSGGGGEGLLGHLAADQPNAHVNGGGGALRVTCTDAAGGGGGGNAAPGTPGEDWTCSLGGKGGAAVDDHGFTRLLLGGGGGEGGADNDGGAPGIGGRGGGAVVLSTASILIDGELTSRGKAGGNACQSCAGCSGSGCGMGGGGGGAGGSVLVRAGAFDLNVGLVDVAGGSGGLHVGSCGGNGGAGGAGRVRIEADTVAGPVPGAVTGALSAFDWAAATPVEGAPTPGAPGAAESMTATELPAGSLLFAVRSRDAVGNLSPLSNVPGVDSAPPTVTIDDPLDGETVTRPVAVQVTATDDVGVLSVRFAVDGQELSVDTAPPWRHDLDIRALVPGPHEISVVATDTSGMEAQAAVTVVIAPAPPAAPVILAPEEGALVRTATPAIGGSAEAWTTVHVYADGDLVASVPSAKAATLSWEAEADAVARHGLTIDGGQVAIAPAGGTATNLALLPGTVVTGGTDTSTAVDGKTTYWWASWRTSAACTEVPTRLGRVALAAPALIDHIRLGLFDDGRQFYGYRVEVSQDGHEWVTWADTAGSGLDYTGDQELSGPPRMIRYVDIWVTGSTTGCDAIVSEVGIFAATSGLGGVALFPLVADPTATLATGFEASESPADGSITWEVLATGDLLADTFEGNAVDPERWVQAGTTVAAGVASVTGTGTWGQRYLIGRKRAFRTGDVVLSARLFPTTGSRSMVGIKDQDTTTTYTALIYGLHFDAGTLNVYEDGTLRGSVGTYTQAQWIDVRIEVGDPAGATTWIRPAGGDWSQVYASAYSAEADLRPALIVRTGTVQLDAMTLRARAWWPMERLSDADLAASRLQVRAHLTRPNVEATSPTVDVASLLLSDGALGAGPGAFRAVVPLADGAHTVTAVCEDAVGSGPPSPPVTFTVDSGPPDAITDLTGVALPGGVVQLGWTAPASEPVTSYLVYRSSTPIEDVSQHQPIATTAATGFLDASNQSATFHYVVVAVDLAGNRSAPSNAVVVVSDKAGPTATVATNPPSPLGLGDVEVVFTLSEPVQAGAVFRFVPPGGAPVTLSAVADSPLVHRATLAITEAMASGQAEFTWSGVDLTGNAGTAVPTGRYVTLDTVRPTATISLTPPPPLGPGSVAVKVLSSEPLSAVPGLAFAPEGKGPTPIPLSGAGGLYQGTLTVTPALGDGVGVFSFQGTDAVGNVGTTLTKGGTAIIDTTPPAPPTDLAAVKTPTGAISLTWSQPGDASTWRVYRDRDPLTSTAGLTPAVTATTTSALDLPPEDGLWHYAVVAVDAAGNASGPSDGASVVASPPPPEDPTGLTVVAAGLTTVTVGWIPSIDSQGTLTGYRVYRDGALVQTLSPSATATTLGGLSPASGAAVRVTAFDAANRESLGATVQAWTLVPNPADLAAEGQDGRVELEWTPSLAPAVLHQAIYMGEAPFGTVAGLLPVATVAPGAASASVLGLTNGQPLWFAVVAVNQSGLFEPAVTPVGATPADHEAPNPPTALKVVESLATSVVLSFTPSTSADLAGYTLKRNGTQVATLPAGASGYTLGGLPTASSNALALAAYDGSGNQSAAATVTAVTLLPNPSGVTVTPHDQSLTVTWAHAQPVLLVKTYRVYAEPAPFTSVTGLTPRVTKWGTSATITGLFNGQPTWVAVTTVNDSDGETQAVTPVSAIPQDDAPPANPGSVTVTASDGTSVTLAWTAPPNPTGDLAGTRLYLDGALVATVGPTLTTHTLTGLAPGSSYAVRLTSFDAAGNESAGATLTVYTTLPNPPVTGVTPGHGSLTLAWTPATPASNVGGQALYVGTAPFVTVAGKAPALVVGPTATSGKVVGLTNGQVAHVAVVTVSKSGGFDPAVVSVPGTPAKDTVGPSLASVTFAGAPLADPVTGDGAFAVDATDAEGVAWVRFLVDGESIGQDPSSSGGWSVAWSPDAAGNGPHALRVEAQDVHGNGSSLDAPFVVTLGPPPPPTLTSPADGAVVGTSTLLVSGTAKAGSLVAVRAGEAAATISANPSGSFTTAITLAPGPNVLTATATGVGGESAPSAPIGVTLDTVTPLAPKALSAVGGEAGAITLSWADAGDSSPSGTQGYRVWRAAAPFTAVGQATLVTATPVTALKVTDLPPADGAWWYGVTKLSKAGLESGLSSLATATSDSTPPTVQLVWTPQGASGGGKVGVGPLALTATFSEPLLATPFLALTPAGGTPMTIQLAKAGDTFTGTAQVTESTPSGTAWAVVSARDLVGNRGTQITGGGTVTLDTRAPEVASLVTDPPAPIANDPDAPVTVSVTVTLDEAMPAGVAPSLTWRLLATHPEPSTVPLASLDPLTWVGGLTLPTTAGAPPEALAFAWLAVDELGNEGTTIHGPAEIEVYQGALPPLAAPLGLKAEPQPGGHIALSWIPVAGASATRVYRRPPGGAHTLIAEVLDPSHTDLPDADGPWVYAVASVRTVGSAVAESPKSPEATATSDRVPPGAPLALALSLTGQGVVAQWSPPPYTEPVTYRLLRSADPITTAEGATVVGSGIPGTSAADPAPTTAERTYAVVAADAVGNLSAPSANQMINAALLPVAALTAVRGAGAPVLTWTHGASDLAGFRVTVDGATEPGLLAAPPFTDAAWEGGSRTYGVSAVDDLGDASPEHLLTLPDLTATLASGSVRRNVISRLTWSLTSPTTVAGVTLALDLGASAAAAPPVTVGPAPTLVDLVVAGAPSLPDAVDATLGMSVTPAPGDGVLIESAAPLTVTNDGYLLQVQSQALVRGAPTQVRLVLQNTSDVTAEVVTATGAGSKPSDQVRFRLEDPDGNLLATAALHQGLGEGVVQVPNGQTVGRAQPGQAFTSAWTTLAVPEAAPDTVVLRAVVDAVHYDLGKAGHVQVPGPSSSQTLTLVPPPYDAAVTSATPSVSQGEAPILIAGNAWQPSGAPAGKVTVRITLTLAGFVRTFDVQTAADGTFTLPFLPPAAEGGVYEVRAGYPGLGDTAPEATFTVNKVVVTPKAPTLTLATGYPTTLALTAAATPGLALTALRVEVVQAPAGITLELPPPQDATGTVSLPIMVTGGAPAPTSSYFLLRVLSDEGTWGELKVTYTLTPAGPALTWSPAFVQTGVARGDVVSETVTIANEGTLVAAGVSVSLLSSTKTTAPTWAFVQSGKQLGDLAVGAKVPVTLTFAPQPSTPLSVGGPTQLWLRVTALGQLPKDVPVYVTVDDSGVGTALFKVSDIYTATLGPDGQLIEGLAGATVKLDKVSGTLQTVKATTDATGEASFPNLPAGTWSWRVSAPGHDAVTGTLSVKSGLTLPVAVFLPKPLVTVEWSVEETTIEDSYTIVLSATFETDVPAPVVVAEPASITLPPMEQGDVLYGEYTLTNYGLIRAEAITTKLPSAKDYKFELLAYPPPDIEAKQSVSVAYRVTRLSPKDPGGDSSGGASGCGLYSYPLGHCYTFSCANGFQSGGCASVTWVTGGSPGNGSGCGGGWWWVGGPGGPGGPISVVGGAKKCDPCEDPGMDAIERKCCKERKKQATGSSVDLVTGAYEDEVVDLSVETLGHTVTASRFWYGNAWHFGVFDGDLDLSLAKCPVVPEGAGTSKAAKAAITLLGIVYESPCVGGASTVFTSGSATISPSEDGWRWQDASGQWRAFTMAGKLLSWGDRAGRAVSVDRDGSGRVIAYRDHFGALALTWAWGADGKVAAAETADGRRVEYTWEAGRLTRVKDPVGRETLYTYDTKGRLTVKQHPSGLVLAITYDGGGNVASVLDQDGAGWFFQYGHDAGSEQDYAAVLGTDGHVDERWWSKTGALVKRTIDGEPVPELDPASVVDLGPSGNIEATWTLDGQKRDTWEYGPWGLPATREDARGTVTAWTWDVNGDLTRLVKAAGTSAKDIVDHVRDGVGRLTQMVARGDGAVTPRTWAYTVNARGQREATTDPLGLTTTTTHDAAGHVTALTLTDGAAWEADYDGAGRLLEVRRTPPGGATTAETHVYAPRLNGDGDVVGQRVTVTDATGTWTLDEDQRGRVVGVTDAAGRTVKRTYDLRGRLVAETDADGRVTESTWESVGFGMERQTLRVDGVVVETTDRDRAGRVVGRSRAGIEETLYYDGGATRPSQRQLPGVTEATTWDGFGLPVQRSLITDDATWTTVWENDGGLEMALTSPFGGRWSVTRDPLGRITSATTPLDATTVVTWDPHGNLASVVDANGRPVATLTYDALDRVATRTVGAQTFTYTWDAGGRLVAIESTAGNRVDLTLDERGRMVAQAATADDAPGVSATYAWDAQDRVIAAQTAEVSVATVWDDSARSRAVTADFGAFSKTWTERTDARGRLASLTLPDGTGVSYGFAPDGTLLTVAVDGEGALVAVQETPLRRALTTPDGTVITHEHDALGRLLHTTVTHAGTTLLERRYVWEAYRLVAIESEHGDYAYTYDAADRLTEATTPGLPPFEATYDPVGNRLTDGAGAWTWDTAGLLASIGDATFGWDARGNLLSRTDIGHTYQWSAANQLVGVTGSVEASYGYGPSGERVRKTVDGQTTWSLWSDRGLLAEYDADGVELRAWAPTPGAPFNTAPVLQRTGGLIAWTVLDHRGAPIALVRGGTVVWAVTLEPFGQGHALVSTVDCPLRPSGQVADPETGLHYNSARMFDPRLGRYLSLDPELEQQGDPNLYQFADASPLIREDVLGTKGKWSGGCSTSGKCNGGAGFSAGAYEGVGGEVGAGAELTTEDCCKDGQPVRNGKTCLNFKGSAEGGFGLGAKGSLGGVGTGASGKLATAGLSANCSVCNKCGESTTERECCGGASINGPSIGGSIGFVKAGLSSGSFGTKLCYNFDSGKWTFTPPGFSGPSGTLGAGGDL